MSVADAVVASQIAGRFCGRNHVVGADTNIRQWQFNGNNGGAQRAVCVGCRVHCSTYFTVVGITHVLPRDANAQSFDRALDSLGKFGRWSVGSGAVTFINTAHDIKHESGITHAAGHWPNLVQA